MKIDLLLIFGGLLFSSFAAIYALFSQPRSLLHRRFSLFMVFLSTYLLLELETHAASSALLYQKLAYLAGLGVAISFCDLSFAYPRNLPSNLGRYLYSILLIWSIYAFSPDFVVRVYYLGNWKRIEHGDVFPHYQATFFLIILFAIGRLIFAFLRSPTLREKLKAGYLLIGVISAGLIGIFGRLLVPIIRMHGFSLPPLALLILGMFTSYALLQERPLDLRVFFKETLFYYFLVAVTIGFYVLMVKWMGDFFAHLLGFSSIYIESLLILVLAFIFKPVAASIENWIGMIFARYSGEATSLNRFQAEKYHEEDLLLNNALAAIKEVYEFGGACLELKSGEVWGDTLSDEDSTEEQEREKAIALAFPLEAALYLKNRQSGIALSREERSKISRFLIQVLTQRENIRIKKEIETTTKLLLQKERMAELGTLAAGLAHELRNPLANIQASAQYLLSLEGVADRKFGKSIVEEVKRVQELVRSFLMFASPLDSAERIDLNEMVGTIVKRNREETEERGITLTFTSKGTHFAIWGHPSFIEAGLENILRNALEATSRGSICLTLKEEERQIVFVCSDTGEGIAREDQANIFTPFFSTKEGGHGLGLAILKKAIDKVNGRIDLHSEKGAGTTFTLFFPKEGRS